MSDNVKYIIRWGPEKNGGEVTIHLIKIAPDGGEQEVGQIELDPQQFVETAAVSTFRAMHLMPQSNIRFEHEHLEK